MNFELLQLVKVNTFVKWYRKSGIKLFIYLFEFFQVPIFRQVNICCFMNGDDTTKD